MPRVSSTRLPVPHLFMVLSIGVFALMTLSAFTPAAADDGGSMAADPGSVPADAAAPAVDGLAVGAFIALLGLLAATVSAGRQRPDGSGRPILGLVTGVLAGLAGATTLFGIGAIALSSPTWVYAPLALSTLGTALGTTAPLPRR